MSEESKEKNPIHKAPERIVVCPKCLVYGATMDLRNSDREVVMDTGILDKDGKPVRRLAKLAHVIKCPACRQITRRIR